MHSLRLDIEDSVFDKVIYFLQNLPKDEVKIIGNKEDINSRKKLKFNAIKIQTKDFIFDREEANAR
jgi:hypothetical protein